VRVVDAIDSGSWSEPLSSEVFSWNEVSFALLMPLD
jgi:hypothetical protein